MTSDMRISSAIDCSVSSPTRSGLAAEVNLLPRRVAGGWPIERGLLYRFVGGSLRLLAESLRRNAKDI